MTGFDLPELVPPTASIREAMAAIERSATKIAVVVDDQGRLLGTATDGNIRRAMLDGMDLGTTVDKVMNAHPTFGRIDEGRDQLLERMRQHRRRQLPLLDAQGRVVRVVTLNSFEPDQRRDNLVFILAGGLGTRLHPLTQSAPKPMLPIGDKPILERIVEQFASQGFHRFCLAVRYKSDQIRTHFGDGARWDVRMDYVVEDEPLGTAGALALLAEAEDLPIVVSNGDILTGLAFRQFVDFHAETGATATMGVRPYAIEIPYGVVGLEGHTVRSIREKPTIEMMVNAGIYCIDWGVVEMIRSRGGWIDMPDVMREAEAQGMLVNGYPIYEYWIDIGQMQDLNRARLEFGG